MHKKDQRDLWKEYQNLKEKDPQIFIYDAAKELGVSEGKLLLSSPDSIYLGNNVIGILHKLSTVGKVKSIVRNENTVHEKVATVGKFFFSDTFGITVKVGGFDVRLYMKFWHHAIAYNYKSRDRIMRSIQFFDDRGLAIQKIYLQDESFLDDWNKIIEKYKEDYNPYLLPSKPYVDRKYVKFSDDEIKKFQNDWLSLVNIHDFQILIDELKLSRQQAFEIAPKGYSLKVPNDSIIKIYNLAQENKIPIMTFVGNRGTVQIQTGIVHNIREIDGWFNIFDAKEEGFTLHLDADKIYSTWVVARPVEDGKIVTCVEGFDKSGHIVLSLFGKRGEGFLESEDWRSLITDATGYKIPKKDR